MSFTLDELQTLIAQLRNPSIYRRRKNRMKIREKAAKKLEELSEFFYALDDEAITTFTPDNDKSAKEQLHAIIDWHIQVATDPAVNGGKVLIDKSYVLWLCAEIERDHALGRLSVDSEDAAKAVRGLLSG